MARIMLPSRAIPHDRSITWALRYALAGLQTHSMLMALIGCYVALGVVASLMIPPWQSPDEPTHFEYARGLTLGTTAETPAIQRPIIESFYQYRFWEYRGVQAPRTVPVAFSSLRTLLIRQTDKAPLYYHLVASAAQWTDDVTLQLYSMRWLSVLLSASAIPIVYLVAREILPPDRSTLALAAAALVAFLPMYAYIGASVNPDNIGAPLGAAAIWLIVRGLRGKQTSWMFAAGILCTLVAFLARRSTIAMIPWALLVAGSSLAGLAWRRLPHWLVAAGAAGCVAAVLVALVWPGSAPAAWAASQRWGQARSDRYAYDGRYSMRLALGARQAPVYLLQSLQPAQWHQLAGRSFVLQAAVRSGDTPVAGQIRFRGTTLTFSKDTPLQPAAATKEATAAFVATPMWQVVSLPMTLPAVVTGASVTVSLSGAGELYVDQLRLVDPASDAPIAIVSNGGGEEALLWWQERFGEDQIVQYLSRILQSARDGVYSSPDALALYPLFLGRLFGSLIGWFGWMSFRLDQGLVLVVGLAWLACLIALADVWRILHPVDRARRGAILWLIVLLLMTTGTILLDYTSFLYALTFPQGRYLFPILAAIAALLIGGLSQLLPARYDRQATAIVVVLLLALNLWSWYGVIIPHFYA
jgi:hypothetical protein